MDPQKRRSDLLELVTQRGTVSIAEIVEALEVSAATARRDLATLADQRLLTRTRGGAAAIGTGYELPLHYKLARQTEAKVAIARAAAALVRPGDTVGLNGGTTTTAVARELGQSARLAPADDGFGLTIVTNALNIGYELSVRSNVRIVLTGGVARRQTYELIGPLVGRALDSFALDLVFLGVDGLSQQYGATTVHEGEAEVSRHFTEVAKRSVVVADAGKIMRSTFARICPLDSLDVLVTNRPVPPPFEADLAAAGVELVVAG